MGGHREAAYWRREAIEARSRAGALAVIHRQNKEKLEEARAECRAVRRRAKGALAAVAEAARLRRLLEQQSVDCRRRSSMVSLRRENGELRREVAALREDNEVLRRALAGTSVDGRLESRIVELERRLCRLKAMRSNDARHRFGDRSERQARPSSPRRRGQMPGTGSAIAASGKRGLRRRAVGGIGECAAAPVRPRCWPRPWRACFRTPRMGFRCGRRCCWNTGRGRVRFDRSPAG